METSSFPCTSSDSTIPSNFILPESKRPHLSQVSTLSSIPIIDLKNYTGGGDNVPDSSLLEKISQACEEYGFFQIINHGIPEDLCNRMMDAIAKLFESMPPEERKQFFTADLTKQVKLFNYYINTGSDRTQDKVQMWSESFSHPWHPTDDTSHLLPRNPPDYRDVFGKYAKEIYELMNRLLRLISQGLGLEKYCLKKRVGENPSLKAQANYYPPCPEPELTLGLNVHTDFNALTVLRQSPGVTGLQVIKDGEWVAVDFVPNAFVINLGDQIQVLSNGRYKSVHHRAVTNKEQRRVTLAMFYGPNRDSVIGPIDELVDEHHPPLYRNYRYSEFQDEFFRQVGTRRLVKEAFEFKK
ncbi:hypothetical protein Ddye_031368 [Dipteronia dyeriana]|uniref:Fe2OG dioxygenase domain-containing protein n=1 Tax=Dipteronia dyeriana TaxID=168575 RepID=A0AAD9TIU0_9ROSI|nr:hypothetical protein Ddye_031368 [Dipteronia dyeriana]